MSQTAEAAFLLNSRGVHRDLDAFVVAARFACDGRHAGFGLGDGSVHIARAGDPAMGTSFSIHDGAVLDLAADPNLRLVSTA